MTKYPSQMQDKFNLRFPDGLRDTIAAAAKESGRSMNSEIIYRLQQSFEAELPAPERPLRVINGKLGAESPHGVANILGEIMNILDRNRDEIREFTEESDSYDRNAELAELEEKKDSISAETKKKKGFGDFS